MDNKSNTDTIAMLFTSSLDSYKAASYKTSLVNLCSLVLLILH